MSNRQTKELDQRAKNKLNSKINFLLKKYGIESTSDGFVTIKNDASSNDFSVLNLDSQVINGTVVGNVTFNQIPFEELKCYFEEQFENLNTNIETIEPLILGAIKSFFQEYHKDIMEMRTSSKLKLDDIKKNQKNLIDELKKICDQGDRSNKELKEKQQEIERNIDSLKSVSNDILYNVSLTFEQCSKNGIEIAEVKNLIKNYIIAAKKSNEQLLSAIQVSANMKQLEPLSAHLDMSKIAEMFAVINDIGKQIQNGKELSDVVEQYQKDIKKQNESIQKKIDLLKDDSDNVQKIANEILDIEKNTNSMIRKLMVDSGEDSKKLSKVLEMLEEIQLGIGTYPSNLIDQINKIIQSAGNNAVDVKDRTQLNNLLDTLSKKEEKIKELTACIAELNPQTAKAIFPCPFCGCEEERALVNGEAYCAVCGHRYGVSEPLDPTDNAGIDGKDINIEKFQERITLLRDQKGSDWRKRHSAILELVSKEGSGENYYRMKLDENHRASSKGVLIIPNITHDNKPIDKVSFCMPNTYDKFSEIQLSEYVKTVILANGVSLSEAKNCFGGEQPFSGKRILSMADLTTKTVTIQKKNEVKNA